MSGGLLSEKFAGYRAQILQTLADMGYQGEWRLLQPSDFGVPQLRPRSVLVALRSDVLPFFAWPDPLEGPAPTVGQALFDLMAANGWTGAEEWAQAASHIGPTLVGGSKKHGGPDLGPTRAKRAWEALGVSGKSIAEHAPAADHDGMPRLTVRMAARIQGFPDDWEITGRKTAAYRQVGNAFPPPVAKAVATQIREAFKAADHLQAVPVLSFQAELALT